MNILFLSRKSCQTFSLARVSYLSLLAALCLCVYLQEEQQILIKKLWKQQKSQKTQTPQTEKQSQKKCLSWLWGKQGGGGGVVEWNTTVYVVYGMRDMEQMTQSQDKRCSSCLRLFAATLKPLDLKQSIKITVNSQAAKLASHCGHICRVRDCGAGGDLLTLLIVNDINALDSIMLKARAEPIKTLNIRRRRRRRGR